MFFSSIRYFSVTFFSLDPLKGKRGVLREYIQSLILTINAEDNALHA